MLCECEILMSGGAALKANLTQIKDNKLQEIPPINIQSTFATHETNMLTHSSATNGNHHRTNNPTTLGHQVHPARWVKPLPWAHQEPVTQVIAPLHRCTFAPLHRCTRLHHITARYDMAASARPGSNNFSTASRSVAVRRGVLVVECPVSFFYNLCTQVGHVWGVPAKSLSPVREPGA